MLRNNACQALSSHRQETADSGSDTIGTKDVIDTAGRDDNCRTSLDLPKTQSHGVKTHRTTFETDGLSGRCPQTQEIWVRGANFPVVSSQGVEVHLETEDDGSECASDGGEC
jgi:hypothetical protein